MEVRRRVSRHHAEVTREGSRVFIRNVSETSPLTVSGSELAPQQRTELRDGAELTFGIAVLRVRITGLPAAFDDEATLPSSRRGGNSFLDDEMTR